MIKRYSDMMKQGFMKGADFSGGNKSYSKAETRAWSKRCAEQSRKRYAEMWGDDWASQA